MDIFIYPATEDGSVQGEFVARIEYPDIIGEGVICFYSGGAEYAHPTIPNVRVPTQKDGTPFPFKCAVGLFRSIVLGANYKAGTVQVAAWP